LRFLLNLYKILLNNQFFIEFKVKTDQFNKKLTKYERTDEMELNDLVNCLDRETFVNTDPTFLTKLLNTRIKNFSEIQANDISLISCFIKLAPDNIILFYFIKEEASRLTVI